MVIMKGINGWVFLGVQVGGSLLARWSDRLESLKKPNISVYNATSNSSSIAAFDLEGHNNAFDTECSSF